MIFPLKINLGTNILVDLKKSAKKTTMGDGGRAPA
jgi:hypothetical protein